MTEVSPFGDVLCRDVELSNSVPSNANGSRQTALVFKGSTSAGDSHVLGCISVYHDASGGVQQGQMNIALNDGADDDTPTSLMYMDSVNGLVMSGKGTFADTLYLTKNSGNSLVVTKDASVGGTLTTLDLSTTQNATIAGTTSLTKASGTALSVTANATVGGTLTASDLSTIQNATIAGTTSLTKSSGTGLSVTADATIGGTLTTLDLSTTQNATIGGTTSLTKASGTGLSVTADATIGGTLTTLDLSTTQNATIGGTTSLTKASGTGLSVTADASVAGTLSLTKVNGTSLNVTADATIGGDLTITGDLVWDGLGDIEGTGGPFPELTVHNGGIDVNDVASFNGTVTLDGANPVLITGADSSLSTIRNDTGAAQIQIHGSAEANPNQVDIDATHLYLPQHNTVDANGGIRSTTAFVVGCDTNLLPAGAVDWTNDIGGTNFRFTDTVGQIRVGTATIVQVEAAQIFFNQQVKFNLASPIIDGANTTGIFRIGNNALASSIDIYGTTHTTKTNHIKVNSQVFGVHALSNFHDLLVSNARPTSTVSNKGFLIERYENDVVADDNHDPDENGTAQSATLSTIKLDATASPTTNFYRGWVIELTAGSGNGLSRKITQYDGVSKIATVSFDWSILPDATSQYRLHKDSYVGLTFDDASSTCSLSIASANTVTKAITPTSQLGLRLANVVLTSATPKLFSTNASATMTVSADNSGTARIDVHGSGHGVSPNEVEVVGNTTVTGNLDVSADLYIGGDLTVEGNTTSINSTTLQVDDKNIELGTTDDPTDVSADGGGITLKGTTDKTILWENDHDNWQSSEHWSVAENKSYQINNTSVLNSTMLHLDAENTGGATGTIMFGDATTDGSMRMRADNNVIYLETRVAGSWVPKHKFKMS